MIDVWEKMQRRGKEGVIRALEDAQLIDVEKALSSRADRFVSERPDDLPTIQRLFVLRLIKIYEQGTPFRRRVYEKDCSKAEWAMLDELSAPEWRLVVTGSENNEAFAEVAHDILLAKWQALSDWITRERQFLLWRTDTEFNPGGSTPAGRGQCFAVCCGRLLRLSNQGHCSSQTIFASGNSCWSCTDANHGHVSRMPTGVSGFWRVGGSLAGEPLCSL
jgi:Novel STAND NTPase 1